MDLITNVTAVDGAAASSAVADTADVSEDLVESTTDDVVVDEVESTDAAETADETDVVDEVTDEEGDQDTKDKVEDKSEHKQNVAARLRELVKRAPELDGVLKRYPQVQDTIAGAFRRDIEYREAWDTPAEANLVRDYFPAGIADVKATIAAVQEADVLDDNFYTRSKDGSYPGHRKVIMNLVEQDRDAALAMLKTIPTLWPEIDKESYNDTFRGIMGSTFVRNEIPEFIADLKKGVSQLEGGAELVKEIARLENWVRGYLPKRQGEESQEALRLRTDRENYEKTKATDRTAKETEFHRSFISQSVNFQEGLVKNHIGIKNLPKSIPEVKRNKIVKEIRERIISHLQKSRSFMSQMQPAYMSMDLQKSMEATRGGWNAALVNRFVKKVLSEELPHIVQGNNAANDKRRTAAGVKTNADRTRGAVRQQPDNTQRPKRQFSMEEVLRGEHLK